MIIVSLNNNYYVTGTVTEVLDEKNGLFVIQDEDGAELYIRLPKDADGNTYVNASTHIVKCDKIRIYGKPTRNTEETSKERLPAKIEGGVFTVLEHEHVFGEATCTEPATCACLHTNGDPLGHIDESGDGICDRCNWNFSLNISNLVINTIANDPNSGTVSEDSSYRTWENDVFSVVVSKGSASLDATANQYMKLRKGNTVTFTAKNGKTMSLIKVTSTTSSYASKIEAAFKNVAGATVTIEDDVVTVEFAEKVESVTITLDASSRFGNVEIAY